MCTGVRFTDTDGNMYFGRNLDWSCGYGETMVATPSGYTLDFAFGVQDEHRPLLGVGIIAEGKPLYFDCANEAGLAVAGLNFPGYAQYEKDAVEGKTNVAAYEFPYFIARNFETVDEVEAALPNIAIVAKAVNDVYPVSLLHWIIGDSKRSISVEYMADGMHVYHNGVDAMTNQPTFAYHLENLRNYMNVHPEFEEPVTWGTQELTPWGSGVSMHGLPGDFSSPSRFVRAAYINTHYPEQQGEQNNVTRLFKTLQSAAMVLGGAQMGNGDFEYTIYSDCFSAKTKTYYFNTYEDPSIKSYAMADFDMDGTELQQAK